MVEKWALLQELSTHKQHFHTNCTSDLLVKTVCLPTSIHEGADSQNFFLKDLINFELSFKSFSSINNSLFSGKNRKKCHA